MGLGSSCFRCTATVVLRSALLVRNCGTPEPSVPRLKKPELSRLDPYGVLMGSLDKVRRYAWYVGRFQLRGKWILGLDPQGSPQRGGRMPRTTNKQRQRGAINSKHPRKFCKQGRGSNREAAEAIYLSNDCTLCNHAGSCRRLGTRLQGAGRHQVTHTHKLFKSPATSHHISIPGCV